MQRRKAKLFQRRAGSLALRGLCELHGKGRRVENRALRYNNGMSRLQGPQR